VRAVRAELGTKPPRRWCNSIHLRAFLGMCLLSRGVDRAEWHRWRRWLSAKGVQTTDAVISSDDRGPATAEVALTLGGLLRHPRAAIREARH